MYSCIYTGPKLSGQCQAAKDGLRDPSGQEIVGEMSEIAEEVVISASLTQF